MTSGSASNAIPLTAAETTGIDVVVTAQDGTTTQRYSIAVSRAGAAASTDTTLSTLSLSGLADFGFDPAIIDYEINVANSVASLSVNANPSEPKATLKVNGKAVENGSDSAPIALADGAPTSIAVLVMAEDANTEQIYTITVNRVPEDITKLPSDFTFSSGSLSLSPAFNPDTIYYTLNADESSVDVPTIPNRKGVTVEVRVNGMPLPEDRMVELERNTATIITITLRPDFITSPLPAAVKSRSRAQVAAAEDTTTANTYTITVLPPWPMASDAPLQPLTLYAGGKDGRRNGSTAFTTDNDNGGPIIWRFVSSHPGVASVKPESPGSSTVVVTPVREGEATITVTAARGNWISDPASFPVTVGTSAAEEAAIRAALSGHGRVMLGSVTEMIGERFDSGTAASGSVCISSAAGADGDIGDNSIAVSRGSHGDSSDDLIAGDTWQGESWNTDLGGMGLRGVPHVSHREEDSMDKTFDELLELFRGRPHSLHPADWGLGCGSGAVGELSRPWTLWAGTDLQWAKGGTEISDFDGAWNLLYLGTDRAFAEQWLGGISLSRVWGEVDYSFGDAAASGDGQLSSSLTAIYPYLHGQ
ncbi:MAG: cadherin-like beta sandwich domain-containing protein, partial [Aphanocapsa feldmannii 277cV]